MVNVFGKFFLIVKTKNNLVWTTRACVSTSAGGEGGARGPYNLMKERLRFLSYVTT